MYSIKEREPYSIYDPTGNECSNCCSFLGLSPQENQSLWETMKPVLGKTMSWLCCTALIVILFRVSRSYVTYNHIGPLSCWQTIQQDDSEQRSKTGQRATRTQARNRSSLEGVSRMTGVSGRHEQGVKEGHESCLITGYLFFSGWCRQLYNMEVSCRTREVLGKHPCSASSALIWPHGNDFTEVETTSSSSSSDGFEMLRSEVKSFNENQYKSLAILLSISAES